MMEYLSGDGLGDWVTQNEIGGGRSRQGLLVVRCRTEFCRNGLYQVLRLQRIGFRPEACEGRDHACGWFAQHILLSYGVLVR